MNKFIKSTLVVLAGTTVFSCNPNLIDEPPTTPTEIDYFTSTGDFREMAAGMYANLSHLYHYGYGWPHAAWLLPGDDLTESNGRRTEFELFDNSLNPTNGNVSRVFQELYSINQRASLIIEKTETVEYEDFDEAEEIPMVGGEAHLLRGYAYFNLYKMFGSVPIVTERVSERAETNIPKSPALDVLNQAISDFRSALEVLPESWPADWGGRVTKNSARGYLVKALVFRANLTGDQADYTEAISVFNSITAVLVPDYIDNFDSYTENNIESLFEVQAAEPPSSRSNLNLVNDGPWRGVEDMSIYRGNMMQPGDLGAFNHYSNTRFLITEKLLTGFGEDPRISVFLDPDDTFEGRIFQKYNLPVGVHAIDDYHGGSLNNERVLRYADVMLLAAEAYVKTGNPSEAIDLVNAVRARARTWAAASGYGDGSVPADHSGGVTDQATIMEWIMDERFVELAGEGHRYWDLKRWHQAGDIDLTGWDGSIEHFSTELASPVRFDVSKHLRFPIPQTEIERNSAITENNPGY